MYRGWTKNVGLVDLELQDQNDPFFNQDISSVYPNIGAGAFLYGDKFYVGVSVPNMLNSVHLDANGTQIGSEVNHFFGTAGYVFQVELGICIYEPILAAVRPKHWELQSDGVERTSRNIGSVCGIRG